MSTKNIFLKIFQLTTVSLLYLPFCLYGLELNNHGKIALVIGIKDYPENPLNNSLNDASDMSAVLHDFGFLVLQKKNLDRKNFRDAIKEFGIELRKDGNKIGLFYFSGHGMQYRGSNYLIPVDAAIEKDEDIEKRGINLNILLSEMEHGNNNFNIVILDACRTSSISRSFKPKEKGLAVISRTPGEMYIAYATSPDSVASDGDGRNGLFTEELLKNIKTPGKKIEDIFKQVRIGVKKRSNGKQLPWDSSSLSRDFYFIPSKITNTGDKISDQEKIVENNLEIRKKDMVLHEGIYWDVSDVYTQNWARALSHCADKSMRLPGVKELISAYRSGNKKILKPYGEYWSGNYETDDPVFAYSVSSFSGDYSINHKSTPLLIRCVTE